MLNSSMACSIYLISSCEIIGISTTWWKNLLYYADVTENEAFLLLFWAWFSSTSRVFFCRFGLTWTLLDSLFFRITSSFIIFFVEFSSKAIWIFWERTCESYLSILGYHKSSTSFLFSSLVLWLLSISEELAGNCKLVISVFVSDCRSDYLFCFFLFRRLFLSFL